MSETMRHRDAPKRKISQTAMEDHWRRRQALQVAAQLPDDTQDALTVLRHAETLVRSFLIKGAA
jgi:hypothetical protein